MSDEELFLNLPSHIISDILSRLPTKTIIQCRCVCNTWLKLFSETEFVNLHLSRSPTCLIINKLDIDPSDSSRFNLVELEDDPDHHGIEYDAETTMKLPKDCDRDGLTMVGSINGLLCLNEFEHRHDTIYLWNPVMRESMTLPIPEGIRVYPNIVSYGFGLSSINGHYKVVRIFQELEKNSRRVLKSIADVYTLGEGSWRRIEDVPFRYSCGMHGVFLNGNLHWLIRDPDGSESISYFSLEKELFSPFPAPPAVSKDFNLGSLGLFGGYLSFCDNTSDFEIVIWVMKEYGIQKTWSKELVIDKEPVDLVGPSYEVVRVLKVFKDGDILLLWRDDIMLCYDSHMQISHQSSVYKLIKKHDDQMNEEESYREERYPCIEAMEYVPSLISLKNFGIELVENINYNLG